MEYIGAQLGGVRSSVVDYVILLLPLTKPQLQQAANYHVL